MMHHYSEYALIVLLLVGLLVWGFNSYRLGKLQGKQKVLPLVIGAVLLLSAAVFFLVPG
jgi:hypothetical protein